nr:aldo/keto reductase [uncultured Sphingobacterium sp.]
MSSINKIGLGTVQFGVDYGISNSSGKTDELEVHNILDFAKVKGITVLDTASAYGSSEAVLGKSNLSCFQIVSKFLLNDKKESVLDHLSSTLRILQQTSIYGYLAHRPLEVFKNSRIWEELNYAKSIGKVEKIGFSFNDVNEFNQVLDSGFIPDIVQVPFNYFDRRFTTSLIELKKLNCEIHTRSAFLQGLFFCEVNDLPPFFDKIKSNLLELQSYGEKLPAMLLNWVIENDFVDKVIIGVNSKNQLVDNVRALNEIETKSLPILTESIPENILMPSSWPKK